MYHLSGLRQTALRHTRAHLHVVFQVDLHQVHVFAHLLRSGARQAILLVGLLDLLESRWKGISFFSRSAEKENDKIKAVMFLFPMLLDTEDPACLSFVSALQDEWNRRFPKWTLRAASSEEIAGGFRRTILGFQIPDKK